MKTMTLNEAQQQEQVTRANRGLQRKLQDKEFAAEHYKKVLGGQTGIGYVSKAHQELHDSIKQYNFITHGMVSTMQVDELNEDLKIAVEYNGDYWHCNPLHWKPNDYNKSIKMTAQEKWDADYRRNKVLEREGYKVIVIWEYDWSRDKEHQIDMLLELIGDRYE